jgi:hypothetical protein
MQAKSSQKTAIGTQKYHNNRIKERCPKRERETNYLTLDILSKIFMETPSPSVSPSSSQKTPSNSGFKNPLLVPVLSDDFEANKMTADNAIFFPECIGQEKSGFLFWNPPYVVHRQ